MSKKLQKKPHDRFHDDNSHDRSHFQFGATLSLPDWVQAALLFGSSDWRDRLYPTDLDKMGLAIALARENVIRETGGPFGACIFDVATGELISVGVNTVVGCKCSLAHAEVMAILLAQKRLGSHSLQLGSSEFVLATSAAPCCQCRGAVWWSGVRELIIGARTEDVEELTEFVEGPVDTSNDRPSDRQVDKPGQGAAIDGSAELSLVEYFAARSGVQAVRVRTDVCRAEACQVLSLYDELGGVNYGQGRNC